MKKGFTLAEVLITLGIIGIVAALTMPTLIQNYRKTLWVNQLKKSMSTIEQGLQKLMADDGVTSLSQLSKPVFGSHNCGSANEKNIMSVFKLADAPKSLDGSKYCIEHDQVPYENTMIIEPYSEFYGDGYYLQDGTLFGIEIINDYLGGIAYENGGGRQLWASLWLDINGEKKGPNQRGRDIFFFYILDNGSLLPLYSETVMVKETDGGYVLIEKPTNYSKWCNTEDVIQVSNQKNSGCAARIIAEGWKMNY